MTNEPDDKSITLSVWGYRPNPDRRWWQFWKDSYVSEVVATIPARKP